MVRVIECPVDTLDGLDAFLGNFAKYSLYREFLETRVQSVQSVHPPNRVIHCIQHQE